MYAERNSLIEANDAYSKELETTVASLKQEIAERKRIESELTSAIASLQKHDEAKSEFFSNVSHEFRTPLTSIKYVTDNMLRGIAGEMSPKAKEYLQMLLGDCDRLARTVEDILDMSRIDADVLKMNWVRAPIGGMVKRTVDSLRVQAEKQGLSIDCAVAPEALFATCDIQKIERVILNIVKNAIKFTPSGGRVWVDVRSVKAVDAAGASIAVKVFDSGPGIPAEHLARVTERYYRVGEYVSGTGLGLAICKELIALHHGTLDLQSPVPGTGNGTQVTVMLPLVPPPQVFILHAEAQTLAASSAEITAQGYSLQIERKEDATGTLPEDLRQPAVLVIDWTAPEMLPAIMLAQWNTHPAFGMVPLLILTGTQQDAARDEIIQGLGSAVLQAPWRPGDVIHTIEGMISDTISVTT